MTNSMDRLRTWHIFPRTSRVWVILFQSLIFLLGSTGIAILVLDSKTLSGAISLFRYYTLQSNLLVMVALALSIWCRASGREDPQSLVIFKSGTVLWILVTGIVYHVMLSGMWHPRGLTAFANQALHLLIPLGMVLNWLIFEKKGRYRYIYALHWLSYPFLYLIGSLMGGWMTGFYPYWFLNPAQPYPHGAGSWANMLLIVGVLSVGFTCLGLVIVSIDRLLALLIKNRGGSRGGQNPETSG